MDNLGCKSRGRLCTCVSGIVAFLLLAMPVQVFAQMAGTGNIQGTVTDATGAVIQNATVSATNVATGVKHDAVTGVNGIYSFPNLAIGKYTIEAAAPSFARYRQTDIVLEVGSSIAVNIAMKVGQTDQTVEVKAAGLALQTEDSSLKQTIDQHTVTEMPLNGRQMTQLVTLSGGAVNANENNDQASSKSFFSSAVISIGGGQGNATDYRLDGADHNDYMTNVNLPFPFPDAVAEFSVETAALGAQSGLHPGGLVNVVTRSGSNEWHGSAFEFIRNNYINARNFFSGAKDTLHQNQYGGTFGGKIIPSKLFGFAGYQRLQARSYTPSTTAYIPTTANLNGDFSATDSPSSIQLVDPLTGTKLIGNNYATTPGVNWANTLNASAKALMGYLPTSSNCTASNYCASYDATSGTVKYGIPSQPTENQFITRIDAVLNSNNSLYGRYFLDSYQSPGWYAPTNTLLTTSAGNIERVQAFTLGETYTINNSLVNTAHASFMRRRDNRGPAGSGINSSNVGVNIYDMTTIGMQVTATNKWSIYCGTCSAGHFNVNTVSFADDMNWIHGKHQIAFGGEYVRTELNINNVYEGNGNFTMSGVFSQKGPAQNGTIGTGQDANLDFLAGAMSSFEQSKAQQNALREPIPSAYIQDTYHITSRIVLSGGIRWDPEYFPTDYFGRGTQFNLSAFLNNQRSTVYPNAPAGAFFYGDKGVQKSYTDNTPWQFSPRFGATFDPTGHGKTVLRVGAALVFDEPNLFTGQRDQQNPPFAQAVKNTPTTSGPLNFTSPWAVGTVTSNPFPLPQIPTASATFQKQSQYIVLPNHFQSPYVMQWTASVQHQFGSGWQLQFSYLGNKTNYGVYGIPMNAAVVNSTVCASMTAGTCTIGNESSRYALTLANPTWGPYYSGGGTGSMYILSGANASYNGMVASIEHRTSSNFVFMANYTYSHCIDISDNAADLSTITLQNPANIKGDKSNCGFDFRHVFNSSLVAISHFNSLHGIAGEVVNHWEISPLVHAMDGAPFTVTSGVDNSATGVGNDRPNLTNPSVLYTGKKIFSGAASNASYINAAAFTQNAALTFGNVGRFAYRGPKFLQTDAALTRTFPLHERLDLNLRIEAFNLLNHPNFGAPANSNAGYLGTATSLTSKTFGDVTAMVNNYGPRIFQGAVKITF